MTRPTIPVSPGDTITFDDMVVRVLGDAPERGRYRVSIDEPGRSNRQTSWHRDRFADETSKADSIGIEKRRFCYAPAASEESEVTQ